MVEEFMLLANVSTAQKTLEEFPDCACLRRHPSPPPSNFDPLIKAAQSKVNDFRKCFENWYHFIPFYIKTLHFFLPNKFKFLLYLFIELLFS